MLPFRVLLAVGTYDGGVASYEMELDISQDAAVSTNNNKGKLQMIFASPIHQGSVRSLMVAATNSNISSSNNKNTREESKRSKLGQSEHDSQVEPPTAPLPSFILVSSGYDEMIKIHDYRKHTTCNGEIRLPTQYGTPNCSSFAPPYLNTNNIQNNNTSTHCLIGFIGGIENNAEVTAGGKTSSASVGGTGGSLVIYKKRDWSVQHVLRGHEGGGIGSIAVHPTGKMALTGGMNDGKIKVWDLQRGRLAYTNSIQPKKVLQYKSSSSSSKKEYDAIVCIVWSNDGECYGYCYGNHITVQHVATGRDLLDVELPSKVNQICFIYGTEGTFVAAACNDGSLPVLAIESIVSASSSSTPDDQERRAIMAIEPVDGPIAREERFKCIQSIYGYCVATANSAGVVSVMNLSGAVNMITAPSSTTIDDDDEDEDEEDDDSEDDDDESEFELAVDIIDSVQIGNGARITCLVAWTTPLPNPTPNPDEEAIHIEKVEREVDDNIAVDDNKDKNHNKKKCSLVLDNRNVNVVELDSEALSKARALVSQAKKIQQKKNAKRMKGINTNR
jgi:WD40 repeat protein